MLIDDPVLPAAAHLTGRAARDVMTPAVAAAGGELHGLRPRHVQYRPGHDLVVRFDAWVSWSGRPAVDETLIAAATVDRPPPGTVPVEATTADGRRLVVGVWRWPFDPMIGGLPEAVTPASAAHLLAGIVSGPVKLTVIAYRPTQRAVVHAVDARGRVHYLKAVASTSVATLTERHRALALAGVPVPAITRSHLETGIVAMEAMPGPTIRERVKNGDRPWPPGDEYTRIMDAVARARIPGAEPVPGRAEAAPRHAAMLAAVMPSDRWRLERITDRLTDAADRAACRHGPTIHGDLYDAQLVTAPGHGGGVRITGLLDVDDTGPGDPVDDRATVLAHLLVRTLDGGASERRATAAYVSHLRQCFASSVDPVDLDLVTAGALVGLATGPFRVQQHGWRHEVRRRLGLAERLVRYAGEKSLSAAS
jgi:hypothetical protein